MKKYAEKLEKLVEIGGTKKEIALLIISGISLILSLTKVLDGVLPFDISWIAIVLCGIPIILEAVIGLITSFDIKADVLVSMALIASVCIGEDFAAGEVAFIMQLGSLLEELTVAKARSGIEKLVKLTPQTARVIRGGSEKIIPAKDVKLGDIIRVLPGETVPVDGVITKGETSVNQSVMTGESMPVDKAVGDEVLSGTVNQFGTFEMKSTKVGEDSSIQRMIKLVESADAGKANIVTLADKWATWIVVIALLAAGLAWVLSGEIIRAVTVLVVFCPCAIVLATPAAIMAGIGNATKHGFLVREGDALERLSKVTKIAFDKTGTLTSGIPKVTLVKSVCSMKNDDVLYFAACAEKYSEHPLGKAIAASYDGETQADNFKMLVGRGVTACVDGKNVIAGNKNLMSENGIETEVINADAEKYQNEGATVICVACGGELCGYIVLSDTLKSSSKNVVKSLFEIGIKSALLTGDNPKAANYIADKLSISEVKSSCLPEDKLEYIKTACEKGEQICMVGDGINDAPSLKSANVSIAMGGVGSDIAVEAADIVSVDDEIKELPHLAALSKKMMTTIKFNLSFSMILNFIAIILAMTGVLNPVIGALVHNAGSVFVIVNSGLLLKWKRK